VEWPSAEEESGWDYPLEKNTIDGKLKKKGSEGLSGSSLERNLQDIKNNKVFSSLKKKNEMGREGKHTIVEKLNDIQSRKQRGAGGSACKFQ